MGNSYKALVEMIGGRLKGIDERLAGMDDRITAESAATREDIAELRKTVNEEQEKQNARIDKSERFVTLRSAIERAMIWGIGITVSVAGVVVGLIRFVFS